MKFSMCFFVVRAVCAPNAMGNEIQVNKGQSNVFLKTYP